MRGGARWRGARARGGAWDSPVVPPARACPAAWGPPASPRPRAAGPCAPRHGAGPPAAACPRALHRGPPVAGHAYPAVVLGPAPCAGGVRPDAAPPCSRGLRGTARQLGGGAGQRWRRWLPPLGAARQLCWAQRRRTARTLATCGPPALAAGGMGAEWPRRCPRAPALPPGGAGLVGGPVPVAGASARSAAGRGTVCPPRVLDAVTSCFHGQPPALAWLTEDANLCSSPVIAYRMLSRSTNPCGSG